MRHLGNIWIRSRMITFISVINLFSVSGNEPLGNNACTNYVYISGSSNINQFSFNYYSTKSTILSSINVSNGYDLIEINIPITDFKPSNSLMYEDFLQTLKASDFPVIKIAFPGEAIKYHTDNTDFSLEGISITIAGVTNQYQINCSITGCYSGNYISGNKVIKLTDFHLHPPSKLYGLIKVNNEIEVHFGFIVTFINSKTINSALN